ncbi:MarR family winged helix-turn-helix transcriptional regulator [Thalassotalea fusca]
MSESINPLSLASQVCFPLYSAANAVVRLYTPHLKKLDLTYPQYIAMMVLWEKKQVSVKQLGEQLGLDSGTLTPLLKRLESKGYIHRNRSQEDERVMVISLSSQGNDLQKEAVKIPQLLLCELPFSSEQRQQLKGLCEALLKAIN